MYSYRTIGLSFATIALSVAPAWGAAAVTRYPYLQSLGRDRVTIMWRTATPAQQTIECGLAGGAFNISATDAAPTTQHEITLTGLEPGKTYNYRLMEAAQVLVNDADFYYFKTDEGASDDRFSFFVTGDIGAELPEGKQILTQAMIRNVAPRADFGLLCGDIIYPDGKSTAYDAQLMTPWRPLLANTTVWPCLGNHDWHVNPDQNFRKEWALPNNEHWYSFDYGRAHFIALDSQDGNLYDAANQLAWLRADLRTSYGRYDWIFVFYHHPVLTCTYKSNIPEMAAQLDPILAEFKVDAVFNGHAHTYERLFPIRNGIPTDRAQNPHFTDPQGTLHIVSGCGAKFKEDEPTTFCGPTAAFVDNDLLFTQVFIDMQNAYFITLSSQTGQVKDYASIRKTRALTDAENAPPAAKGLRQNVPNPFNPTTLIPFEVTRSGRVKLRIFQPDGTLVRDLVDAKYIAGSYQAEWDGRDAKGNRLASGAYICRLEAEDQSWSIKMVMVR